VEELGEKAMLLQDAIGVTPRELISLIGSADKTTTMFRLAKELRDQNRKVLVTTTTEMSKPTKPHVDRLFLIDDVQALINTCEGIAAPVVIGAGCRVSQEGKLLGLPATWLDRLNQHAVFDAILVVADRIALKVFKLPAEGEPLIPQSCQTTIWCVAVKVLGKPLTNAWVDQSAKARDLLGSSIDDSVSQDTIIRLVQHPDGCLKGIPPESRKIALINQADSPAEMAAAHALGNELQKQRFEKVIIASYASVQPVIHRMAH
jgi:probable selenium-dependent hydroxylase accessory protein YqeC